MTPYYSPNNLRAILPFLEGVTPAWFILGGPADACEAQEAVKLWCNVRVVGVEPNSEAVAFQRANGWRVQWPLVEAALSDREGNEEMVSESGGIRNASISPESVEGNRGGVGITILQVPMVTLDGLEAEYGPFENAVVWLDIEGSELRALQGGTRLLASRRVLLWNVEMLTRHKDLMTEVPRLMAAAGYRAVADWNDSDECRDRIFLRDDVAAANPLCRHPEVYRRNPADPLLKIL